MILVDANILVYAYNSASEQHTRAAEWLDSVLSKTEPVGFSWSVIHAYLRLVTNRRILANPFTIDEAIAVVDEWLTHPVVSILNSGPGYWFSLRRILAASQVHADLVNDAHLAALAVEHNAIIYTADHDFRRFKGVRVINPLA